MDLQEPVDTVMTPVHMEMLATSLAVEAAVQATMVGRLRPTLLELVELVLLAQLQELLGITAVEAVVDVKQMGRPVQAEDLVGMEVEGSVAIFQIKVPVDIIQIVALPIPEEGEEELPLHLQLSLQFTTEVQADLVL